MLTGPNEDVQKGKELSQHVQSAHCTVYCANILSYHSCLYILVQRNQTFCNFPVKI